MELFTRPKNKTETREQIMRRGREALAQSYVNTPDVAKTGGQYERTQQDITSKPTGPEIASSQHERTEEEELLEDWDEDWE